jgi:hypothetical protein
MHAMWKMANRRLKALHGVILITMMYMRWHMLIAYCRDLHARCARDDPACLICKSDGLRLAWLG